MSTIQPRDLTCPYCDTAFSGWLVLASPSRGPKSSDLRQFDDAEDPLPKQLDACPGCGFVGEVSDFEEHAVPADRVVRADRAGAFYSQGDWDDAHDPMLVERPEAAPFGQLVTAHLTPAKERALADAAFRYEQHGQVRRWRGDGPLREGDCWLRAAWLHGDAGRADDERRCRQRAVGCYRQGVQEREWFKRREDLVVIAYLCGELHRRLDEADEAQRWFEQAVAWSSGLPHMQELVELAERQARDPRDVV